MALTKQLVYRLAKSIKSSLQLKDDYCYIQYDKLIVGKLDLTDYGLVEDVDYLVVRGATSEGKVKVKTIIYVPLTRD